MCTRLVEVREALTHIRRKQALQDSERKAAEQEAGLRLAELTERLKQEAREWEVACRALQKSQEAAGQRVDVEVARMQGTRDQGPSERGAGQKTSTSRWRSG